MNRETFIREHEATWREFERMLESFEKRRPAREAHRLPSLYRAVCRDLATAQHRMYGIAVIDRLNRLVIRGYKQVYRSRGASVDVVLRYFLRDFPLAVRREWRLFWLTMAFYWLPFFAMVLAAYHAPVWIQAFLGPGQMAALDASWSQGPLTRGGFGEDLRMFGFYIYNNISIDFKTFAGGVLGGIGTLFFMVFNGLMHGAVAGYVHMQDYKEAFYSFVSGHSAMELLAMVFSGMAGMKIGLAILRPGRRSRAESFRRQAKGAMQLLIGAAIMTFVAACIEGFWSASPAPVTIKYVVGIMMWVVLALYFLFVGGRADEA